MYSDKKKKHTRGWILLVVAVLLVAGLVYSIAGGSSDHLTDESAAAIREAIRRSALQCYVVEGVYPSSLSYLEEKYGLQINTEDFYVTYEAFSSNLPPDIKVTRK